MIDLFLPLIIGIGIGIDPPDSQPATVDAGTTAQIAEPMDSGSGDDLDASRAPEPQIATGKFTTAVEVRPILSMTKAQWVGVREYNDSDYVYFTQLMAWRCGLWDIRYGINGAPADNVMAMEPCNEEFAQPNVMVDIENYLPYVIFPLGSVDTITIEIVFDDGTSDSAQYDRADVRIP